MSIIDPPPAPEGMERLRAQDLKNRVCIIRPQFEDTLEGKDGKPWNFVECDVWVLDRAGIEAEATGVRISWWKAVAQLRGQFGGLVACRPVEQPDNSIELTPLVGDARAVAERVATELEARGSQGAESALAASLDATPAYDPGTEPF